MICKLCNTEFDESFNSFCPACGKEIDMEDMNIDNLKWVMVYTTNTLLDAEMYKANLEGAEIPVEILSQVDSARMFTVGGLAVVKIFVPSLFYQTACKIIEAINWTAGNEFEF
jgi:hypothetical protein